MTPAPPRLAGRVGPRTLGQQLALLFTLLLTLSIGAYAIKPALYGFDFTRVARLNVRWMRTCGRDAILQIKTITMLAEQPTSLSRIALKVGNTRYHIADTLTTGETLDVSPDGTVSRCKESDCNTTRVPWPTGRAVAGQTIQLQATGDATAEVTLGLIGAPLRVER